MKKCKFYNECKNQQLLWDLYAGIVRDAKKNQRLLWRLYVGIATNEECAQLFVPYMWVLQGTQNVSGYYGTHMRVLQRM